MLPWLDGLKSRQFTGVWLKFVYKEWQWHSMYVPGGRRQRSVDIRVGINPNYHLVWFSQGVAVNGPDGQAVIPAKDQAGAAGIEDFVDICRNLWTLTRSMHQYELEWINVITSLLKSYQIEEIIIIK